MDEQTTGQTEPEIEAPPPHPLAPELERIRAAVPGLEPEAEVDRSVFWINLPKEALVRVVTLLRDDPELDYVMLSDLFGVDYPAREKRFELLYNLYSLRRNRRVFLRVKVGENEPVPTLALLFQNANWAEREIYDLFGVPFEGHPDLRRILMPDDWDGYPLRKDYPLIGKRSIILYNDVREVT
jgi:NADH-quinone oxidoreductase subunit C